MFHNDAVQQVTPKHNDLARSTDTDVRGSARQLRLSWEALLLVQVELRSAPCVFILGPGSRNLGKVFSLTSHCMRGHTQLPLLMPHPLPSHWAKQVMWPSLTPMGQEYFPVNGRNGGRGKYLLGNNSNYNIHLFSNVMIHNCKRASNGMSLVYPIAALMPSHHPIWCSWCVSSRILSLDSLTSWARSWSAFLSAFMASVFSLL